MPNEIRKKASLRRAARVVVVSERGRVFLLRYRSGAAGDPAVTGIGAFWIVPGGKLEHGESPAEAAARELREETGIVRSPAELGAPIAHRRADLWIAGTLTPCEEWYFICRVASESIERGGWTALERADIEDEGWFGRDELLESDAWDAELAPRGAGWFYAACAAGELPGCLDGGMVELGNGESAD